VTLDHRRAKWTYIFPINGVALTDAVNQEFRINRMTLISLDALAHRRRRFGIPSTIPALRQRHEGLDQYFLAA